MSKKERRDRWCRAVLERDGHACRLCGRKANFLGTAYDLDVHHIVARNSCPGGGYVVTNGVSLCRGACHRRAEAGGDVTPAQLATVIGVQLVTIWIDVLTAHGDGERAIRASGGVV